MALIGEVWIEIFLRPMLNALVLLYLTLSHNFGLGIIVFTLIVRVATYPLTVKQTKASPYSYDENMWSNTAEGAEIEDPSPENRLENRVLGRQGPAHHPSN